MKENIGAVLRECSSDLVFEHIKLALLTVRLTQSVNTSFNSTTRGR